MSPFETEDIDPLEQRVDALETKFDKLELVKGIDERVKSLEKGTVTYTHTKPARH